jgi:hypothetical protein
MILIDSLLSLQDNHDLLVDLATEKHNYIHIDQYSELSDVVQEHHFMQHFCDASRFPIHFIQGWK